MKKIACILTILSALLMLALPCFSFASAEEIDPGQQVLDDTRYSYNGFAPVDTIINLLTAGYGEVVEDAQGLKKELWRLFNHATNTAVDSYSYLKGYAIDSTNGYTIQEVTSLIGKRKILYPYNNMMETDYFYVYINKNAGAQVQQFGDYTIAPNTMLIIRQTNWAGVQVASLPIGENGTWCPIVSDGLFTFRFYAEPQKILTFNTPMGSEKLKIGSGYSAGYYDVRFVNNDYNTIQDMYLVDYYTSHNNSFGDYQNDGEPLDWVECILGCPLNSSRNSTTLGGRGVMRPIYLTTLYSNYNARDKTGFNKDPNNIDPKKAPVYIMPDTHPLACGKQITETNITNYNDYGITNVNGTLDVDPTVLAGALVPQITPTFKGVLDGTFNAQPEIGLDFNTPLDLDLPSIVDNYVDILISRLPSGGDWQPPTYPPVNTAPLVSYTYPVLPTETVPQNVLDDVGTVTKIGFDVYDTLGTTVIATLIALAVLGAVSYYIWG